MKKQHPALPLTGEGAKKSHAKADQRINSSPCEGGGREGVNLPPKIFNTFKQKHFRVQLRNNLTTPEQTLWQELRSKQLSVKFRRQHGIGHYIADFYCAELSLVIEVDGDSHYVENSQDYDDKRNEFMRALGIVTLRFSNHDIMKNMDGVLMVIVEKVRELKRG